MNRETLSQLEENFKNFIGPLLDETDTEDVGLAWEFQKFIHMKRLRLLTMQNETIKHWKQALLSR